MKFSACYIPFDRPFAYLQAGGDLLPRQHVRRAFAARAAAEREELRRFFVKTGIDTMPISTDRPYVDEVRRLFKRRARKR